MTDEAYEAADRPCNKPMEPPFVSVSGPGDGCRDGPNQKQPAWFVGAPSGVAAHSAPRQDPSCALRRWREAQWSTSKTMATVDLLLLPIDFLLSGAVTAPVFTGGEHKRRPRTSPRGKL